MTAQFAKSLVFDHVVSSTSQFIGRHRELSLIWNQFEAATGGRASVVLLVGELGIGKTRLLEEVAACAVQDGATVLRGGASESEGMPPYLPFLEALGKYIRITSPDQLREQVAVAPQILASLLPELAVRLDGELPVAYPLSPEQARLRLYEAVGTFLERISAPHGLVLMLDDLHFSRQPHRSPPQSLPAGLTASEAKVLQLVVTGKSNRQIAPELGLSEKTVANHLTHVFNKTNSENRAAATAFAIRHKLA